MSVKNTDALPAKSGFKFGCDPELFVKDRKGNYVTAEGLLPGTKAEPYPVEFGAVQVDGMAAEFNTDPVDNFVDFNRNITMVLKQLKAMLPKGYTLDAVPAVTFDAKYFDEVVPENAKELGCSPDYDAWSGEVNVPPNCPDKYLRTASGHLHIGWTENADLSEVQHIMNCRDLVKQLDWYLGGWAVRLDRDNRRRQLYGKAGAYRPKSYGVEYRVLSNFWITNKENRLLVWNRMQKAIEDMAKRFMPDQLRSDYHKLLIESINSSTPYVSLDRSARYPLVSIDPMDEGPKIRIKTKSSPAYGDILDMG